MCIHIFACTIIFFLAMLAYKNMNLCRRIFYNHNTLLAMPGLIIIGTCSKMWIDANVLTQKYIYTVQVSLTVLPIARCDIFQSFSSLIFHNKIIIMKTIRCFHGVFYFDFCGGVATLWHFKTPLYQMNSFEMLKMIF